MIKVAFFGDITYPSHNIKWINTIASVSGVKCIVFTTSPSSDHLISDIVVKPFYGYRPKLPGFKRTRLKGMFLADLKEHSVDLVHFLWGLDSVLWARDFNLPYIITTRGSDVLRGVPSMAHANFGFNTNYLRSKLSFYQHMLAYRDSSCITSTSVSQQEQIRSYFGIHERLRLVRTGVNVDEIERIKISDRSSDTLKVFSPRTMKPLYNQEIILRGFKLFIEKFKKSRLYMIDNCAGSDYSNMVRGLCQELGLDNSVEFLPELDKENMIREYRKSDIVIMIPETDGTPVSAVEAMLCKKTLILGSYSYDSDLFPPDIVFQLSENSPESVFNILKKIVSTPSEELKKRTEEAYLISKEKADTSKEMNKVIDIYKTILA